MAEEVIMGRTPRRVDPVVLMSIGGVLGGLAGFAIWMVTDTFVFLPIFLAAGLVTGISIAQSR